MLPRRSSVVMKLRGALSIVIVAAFLSALLAGCGATSPPGTPSVGDGAATVPAENPTVNVVVTTSVIGDLVKNVGGSRVTVYVLLPAGADAHTYHPAPTDAQKLTHAELIVRNGLGLDDWLDRLVASAESKARIVVASDGMAVRHGDADEGHGADEADPHVWFDARRVQVMCQNIAAALKEVDPAGAESYGANLASYSKSLDELDTWILETVQRVPAERRKLVTNHESLGYFAERYGFEVVGTVIRGLQADREPSAREMAELAARISDQGVPAIFVDSSTSSRLAEALAMEANVKMEATLYHAGLAPEPSPASTYIGMMRHNVETIVAALK